MLGEKRGLTSVPVSCHILEGFHGNVGPESANMDRKSGREVILDHKTERAGGPLERLGMGRAVKARK